MSWIFAYGSLMGDNALRFYQGKPARLVGFHRAFNHSSAKRWGTAEHPCPVLGLSPGRECAGIAFEIPRGDERNLLRQITHREGHDELERKRLPVHLDGGPETEALVWVTRRAVLQNSPWPADRDHLARAFREAHGTVGTGVEYVRSLIHAFERWQIRDSMIESLWDVLRPYSNPKG